MQITDFGTTRRGQKTKLYTIQNSNGLEVGLSDYGATVVFIKTPDKDGHFEDIVLGFDSVAGYESEANMYFGCTIGRYANRIAKGQFELGGQRYELAINNGPNHLHGGLENSFDKKVWVSEALKQGDEVGVIFKLVSPHLEEGYPGEISVEVKYTLNNDNELRIDYGATTTEKTILSMTNHSYFNCQGEGNGDILSHDLMILSETYTPSDENLVPTGELASVEGTVFDFRKVKKIGQDIHALDDAPGGGYDHNFILDHGGDLDRVVARLSHEESGRSVEVRTTEPGLQFYSGNFLNGGAGKGGKAYPHRSACCLETQHYPDSPNQPHFPTTVVNKGERWHSTTIYKLGAH